MLLVGLEGRPSASQPRVPRGCEPKPRAAAPLPPRRALHHSLSFAQHHSLSSSFRSLSAPVLGIIEAFRLARFGAGCQGGEQKTSSGARHEDEENEAEWHRGGAVIPPDPEAGDQETRGRAIAVAVARARGVVTSRSVCVCVCVCERERERGMAERKRGRQAITEKDIDAWTKRLETEWTCAQFASGLQVNPELASAILEKNGEVSPNDDDRLDAFRCAPPCERLTRPHCRPPPHPRRCPPSPRLG